jgi:hypothetical protein
MTCTWGAVVGSVTVKSVNACGQSAARSKTVSLLACMEEQSGASSFDSRSEFEVYPNPTFGLLIIKTSTTGEFELLNGVGQLLDSFVIGLDQTMVKELFLPTAGLYFIRSKSDGQVRRIVVAN